MIALDDYRRLTGQLYEDPNWVPWLTEAAGIGVDEKGFVDLATVDPDTAGPKLKVPLRKHLFQLLVAKKGVAFIRDPEDVVLHIYDTILGSKALKQDLEAALLDVFGFPVVVGVEKVKGATGSGWKITAPAIAKMVGSE